MGITEYKKTYTIPFARWYAILVTDLPTSSLDFSLQVLKSHTCKIDDSIVSKLMKTGEHTQLSLILGLKGTIY